MTAKGRIAATISFRILTARWIFPVVHNRVGDTPKAPLSLGGSRLPSNMWFLWPTRVRILNGISIGSAVFARLTVMSNRHRDHLETIRHILCRYNLMILV